ncbi:MAG: hypothetical protein VXW84_11770 [Verrucomicrobiota bacterium]|nr:hypothetical protein [Verrucomicrobiota bacterium]
MPFSDHSMVDRQITQCLEQWESITVREAEAIEGQDWEALKGLHQSKAEMMEQLDGWLAQKEVDRSAFQSIAQSVLSLEMRNSQSLKEKTETLQSQMNQTRGSQRRLGQIRSAYGGHDRQETMLKHYS